MSRHEHVALMILDAELAVLLVHLVILLVLLAYAVEVEHHLALVIHQLHEVGERVGVVSHGTCEHHLEIETRYHLAVQVDVAGDSLLLLGHGECSQLLLKLQHDSLRALHRLDIAVKLSRHLVAHELVYALQFDTVDISIFKVFLRYLLFHSNCYLSIYLGYTNQH